MNAIDPELHNAVRALAAARRAAQDAACAREAIRQEIAESALGQQLTAAETRLLQARDAEATARAQLDELAQMHYAAHGDKRPHPAVAIRELTMLEYDPKVARQWAETNLRAALVLDHKKFEKAVKDLGAPDFVRIYTTPQVTVSADLEGYAS